MLPASHRGGCSSQARPECAGGLACRDRHGFGFRCSLHLLTAHSERGRLGGIACFRRRPDFGGHSRDRVRVLSNDLKPRRRHTIVFLFCPPSMRIFASFVCITSHKTRVMSKGQGRGAG